MSEETYQDYLKRMIQKNEELRDTAYEKSQEYVALADKQESKRFMHASIIDVLERALNVFKGQGDKKA